MRICLWKPGVRLQLVVPQGLYCSDTQWLIHPATLGRRPEEQRRKRLHQPNPQLPAQVSFCRDTNICQNLHRSSDHQISVPSDLMFLSITRSTCIALELLAALMVVYQLSAVHFAGLCHQRYVRTCFCAQQQLLRKQCKSALRLSLSLPQSCMTVPVLSGCCATEFCNVLLRNFNKPRPPV